MSDVSSEHCSGKGRKIHVKAVLEEAESSLHPESGNANLSKIGWMFKPGP